MILLIPSERESPADLAKYGLSDARIVTWKQVPYKRMLEYLFYIHNPNISESVGELEDILESGFKDTEYYLVTDLKCGCLCAWLSMYICVCASVLIFMNQ